MHGRREDATVIVVERGWSTVAGDRLAPVRRRAPSSTISTWVSSGARAWADFHDLSPARARLCASHAGGGRADRVSGRRKVDLPRPAVRGDSALVSKDLLRNNRRPERRQQRLIAEALAAGTSVVVDNTNPSVEERAAIIETARASGARAVGYFFDSPLDECAVRNQARPDEARVPDVGLFATAKRFVRPSLREGFDEIVTVRTLPDLRFEIGPYQEAPDDPDDFEQRMRALEYFHDLRVLPGTWPVLRLDGRSFSRLTEARFEKPFDLRFHELMCQTTEALVTELGATYGYTESDEISLLLPNTSDVFDRSVEKLVSIAASIAGGTFSLGSGRWPSSTAASGLARSESASSTTFAGVRPMLYGAP